MRFLVAVAATLIASPLIAQPSGDSLVTGLVAHRVVLVDSVGGQPLPAEEGPWRLIAAGDAHGARSARMVSAIRLREP